MRFNRIVRHDLRSLKDFPSNPNKHSKKQLRKMAETIKELGFIGAIVIDEEGFILAGHARRKAALMAGIEQADCIVVEHLSQAQKRAFLLAGHPH